MPIAPTEKRRGQLSYLGDSGRQFRGRRGSLVCAGRYMIQLLIALDGVAGHAGLFSTANDLSIYCQMILRTAVSIAGVRVPSPLTVAEMTRPRLVNNNGGTRGLGWDINTSYRVIAAIFSPLLVWSHRFYRHFDLDRSRQVKCLLSF